MRPLTPLLSLLLAVAPAAAQGAVNESLLRAPTGRAAKTWSTDTFEAVQASVVHVAVEVDGPRGAFVLERASSGVVVDERGYVVTFHHLIAEAIGADGKRLLVQLNDASNTRLKATLVRHDEASGLCLLSVTPPADGLQAAELGPALPQWGEPVLVVARPEGEDMLAFAGVASRSLAQVSLHGRSYAADELFLTDSRNDIRCDGAPVFGADHVLLGLYASEHVTRNVGEPTLEDLKRPSFGVVVPAARVRRVFAKELVEQRTAGGAAPARTGLTRAPHAFAAAVAEVAPSVVGVYGGDGAWPLATGDDPGMVQRRPLLGSGVVATASGLVLTNAHVAARAADVRVKVGEQVFAARVMKSNLRANLSLLELDLPDGVELVPATFGVDDDLELGEAVLAVGNPTGQGVVVSGGVISAMRAREGGRIQSDANLGNQNGGGAIIDASGRVVGIGDAGLIDPIDMAFAQRGERATQESNLSTFVGVRQVRKLFGATLKEAGAAGSIVSPAPADAAARALRRSPLTEMVAKASGAMLNIYVARNVAEADPDDPFPPDPIWRPMSLGSGVIVHESGLAVSNWHVVDDGTFPDGSTNDAFRITARAFGGREFEVRVLSISREDDLSLLQLVLEDGEQVQAVELGNSDLLAIGEAVAAIGNPHGRSNTITYGVVSAKGQGIRVRGRWAKLKHLIETDAAINGGNSGGALLDMDGRLVGINSAGGGTFNNVGYAISVDHVRRQLTGLLMQPYKLRSVDLGLRVLDDEQGVVVMDVHPEGPAARAGVRSGDRISSLAGVAITWSPGFARTLLAQQARAPVELVVTRDGERLVFPITPLPPETFSVLRQCGLETRDFSYVEDPERVRKAAIGLYRAYTGVATGEPRVIPSGVVEVVRASRFDGRAPQVQPGDLILAVELRGAGGAPALTPIETVAQLRDLFNDRVRGKTEDVDHYKVAAEYPVWIARGGEVLKVTVAAVRLLP